MPYNSRKQGGQHQQMRAAVVGHLSPWPRKKRRHVFHCPGSIDLLCGEYPQRTVLNVPTTAYRTTPERLFPEMVLAQGHADGVLRHCYRQIIGFELGVRAFRDRAQTTRKELQD